jgi:hypothetical protein
MFGLYYRAIKGKRPGQSRLTLIVLVVLAVLAIAAEDTAAGKQSSITKIKYRF